MSYIDDYNETELSKLTRRLTNLYRHAYDEVMEEQADYWKDLERRVQKTYAEYQQGAYTKQQWEDWVRAQVGRGKTLDSKAADIANRLAETGQIASGYINATGYKVFAENANFEAFSIERDHSSAGISFNLVNEEALKSLETENHLEFDARWKQTFAQPKEIYKWNYDRVQTSVYQGILRGESAYKIADRIQQVTNSSRVAALRNARTSITSAANAGTMTTMRQAKEMGLDVQKEWVSFQDARTRDSHAYLDGVRVGLDEEFPNGLRYPGDPKGAPAELYNCRCTLVRARHGEEKRTDNDAETYKDWKEGKIEQERSHKGLDRSREIKRSVIESPDYGRRLSALRESRDTQAAIKENAIAILDHRNGTKFEDLSFIDSKTGKYRKQVNYDKEFEVKPTKKMLKMLESSDDYSIIAMHNHSGSNVPSWDDIQVCADRKYKYGIVACHNGNIYKYEAKAPNLPAYIQTYRRYDSGKISLEEFIKESEKANVIIEVL